MAAISTDAKVGLAIAAGVLVLTGVFAWKQWIERVTREDDLSSDDARYFTRRDIRRGIGTTLLGLIGIGMIVGSLLSPKTQAVPFVWVWCGVGALVMILMMFAMLDWFANFGYAARHRRLLIEEHVKLIEDEYKKRRASTNGHGHGH